MGISLILCSLSLQGQIDKKFKENTQWQECPKKDNFIDIIAYHNPLTLQCHILDSDSLFFLLETNSFFTKFKID